MSRFSQCRSPHWSLVCLSVGWQLVPSVVNTVRFARVLGAVRADRAMAASASPSTATPAAAAAAAGHADARLDRAKGSSSSTTARRAVTLPDDVDDDDKGGATGAGGSVLCFREFVRLVVLVADAAFPKLAGDERVDALLSLMARSGNFARMRAAGWTGWHGLAEDGPVGAALAAAAAAADGEVDNHGHSHGHGHGHGYYGSPSASPAVTPASPPAASLPSPVPGTGGPTGGPTGGAGATPPLARPAGPPVLLSEAERAALARLRFSLDAYATRSEVPNRPVPSSAPTSASSPPPPPSPVACPSLSSGGGGAGHPAAGGGADGGEGAVRGTPRRPRQGARALLGAAWTPSNGLS
jgi:hypothetical protein